MSSSISDIVDRNWFQPRTREQPARWNFVAEVRTLRRGDLRDLIRAYEECLGQLQSHEVASAEAFEMDPVTRDELARFLHALTFCRYGLDGAALLPPDLRAKRLASYAETIGWPEDRFRAVVKCWSSSALFAQLLKSD